MYLLIPGRHHLLTTFQFRYLHTLIQTELKDSCDIEGNSIQPVKIEGVIFAVTSANHSGTKRNPLPFYIRAMMIQSFASDLPVKTFIYGIDDVGIIDNFPEYTIKQIRHQSDLELDLNPSNTMVICSTPVLKMYQACGYKILPAELKSGNLKTYRANLPWYWVEKIGQEPNWTYSSEIIENIHHSTLELFKVYKLGERIRQILNDPIIGEDGDITETRDYNSYVRQMDEIAELKFADTADFIQAGNVGDIGCAVGSWIKLACEDPRLAESDFYGIEVARKLFNLCVQRKQNDEFKNPNVFFSQKNAVTDLVFQKGKMNTIHTSSLTHEIFSYGSIGDLKRFIKNRFEELQPGGVWINRDVIGPENGDREVYLWLNDTDGILVEQPVDMKELKENGKYLDSLSTYSKFLQFAHDFRKDEADKISYEIVEQSGEKYAKIRLKDACEFMLTKDYTDNWESEMHERFCFWSIDDWKNELMNVGFRMLPGSHAYTNPWIKENRFNGKVKLFELQRGKLKKIASPPTNAIIVGQKF